MLILDPLLGVIAYGAEASQLDVIGYGTEVRAVLTQPERLGAELCCVNTKLV
jgi:hypothetical protein